MSTIIKSISFKNFYNYSGDYERNTYVFTKGINIVNADNGMGKSKLYNGFLWILKNKVYDSDARQPVDIMSCPLKVLSDQAKGSNEVTLETGVRLVYENDQFQYSIEKTISFTKTNPAANFNNTREWRIGDIVTLVTKSSLNALSRPIIVYDVSEKDAIIRNLIVPAMQPYALLRGEAIDNIVDLSNSSTLTSTIETLTDLSSLKIIEKSCQTFTRNAKSDLSAQQRTQATNVSVFEDLAGRQKTLERQISEVEARIETFKIDIVVLENNIKLFREISARAIEIESRLRPLASKVNDSYCNIYTDSFNYGNDANLLEKYNRASADISKSEELIRQSYETLDKLRAELDKVECNISSLDGVRNIPIGYINLRNAMMDAQLIFENTRKRIYDEVISKLETKANEFYAKLTAGNNVMGGTMRFERTDLDTIEVKVLTNNGSELTCASEGFQRMKKIAVVMAINSFWVDNNCFEQPFIADAPLSVLDGHFVNNFIDTITYAYDQSIIMINDLCDKSNDEHLSEEGRKILKRMQQGLLYGTFYINKPVIDNPLKLHTEIEICRYV